MHIQDQVNELVQELKQLRRDKEERTRVRYSLVPIQIEVIDISYKNYRGDDRCKDCGRYGHDACFHKEEDKEFSEGRYRL